jgi:hypothetical protein
MIRGKLPKMQADRQDIFSIGVVIRCPGRPATDRLSWKIAGRTGRRKSAAAAEQARLQEEKLEAFEAMGNEPTGRPLRAHVGHRDAP